MIVAQHLLFDAVRPHLSRDLVSEPTARRLGAFLARLPAAFTWGGVELRLRGDDESVDFGACAAAWEGSREAIAAALDRDRELPVGSLRPFLERWSRGDGPSAEMPHFWLEYDDPAHDDGDPVLFFSADPQSHDPGSRTPIPTSHLLDIARFGLTLALGELPGALWDTYERCARLLVEGGRVMSVAPLHPRGRAELRMDASLPRQAIGPWLDAIGWPGDRRSLALLFDLLGPGWNRNNVEIDLGDDVGPALGFLYQPTAARLRKASWLPLMGRLVELGLCDRERGRAVVEWLGAETVDLPGLPWHVSVQRDLGFKLEARPDGELRAKAYLCYWPTYTLL